MGSTARAYNRKFPSDLLDELVVFITDGGLVNRFFYCIALFYRIGRDPPCLGHSGIALGVYVFELF